eukprot:3819543-Pyramimonas_sp.AAC.1
MPRRASRPPAEDAISPFRRHDCRARACPPCKITQAAPATPSPLSGALLPCRPVPLMVGRSGVPRFGIG